MRFRVNRLGCSEAGSNGIIHVLWCYQPSRRHFARLSLRLLLIAKKPSKSRGGAKEDAPSRLQGTVMTSSVPKHSMNGD